MANRHSKRTQQLDTKNATATATFSGLGLFYFHSRGHYEGYIMRREGHDFSIEAKEITPNGEREILLGEFIDPNAPLDITVTNPAQAGSYRFQRGPFRPTTSENDVRDFRWFVDMEGPRLHKKSVQKLDLRHPENPNRLQRLRISDATYYTAELSDSPYCRQELGFIHKPGVFIGKIARVIGAAITCSNTPGSGITLKNPGSEKAIFLPKKPDSRYEISIVNRCPWSPSPSESDFILYYEVLKSPDNKRYDLFQAVRQGGRAPIKALKDWFVNGSLVMCDGLYLSRTSEFR